MSKPSNNDDEMSLATFFIGVGSLALILILMALFASCIEDAPDNKPAPVVTKTVGRN